MTENAIATEIVDAAFRIHTTLGPGLLESVYQTVLAYEPGLRGLRAVSQQPIPVVYENIRIDTGFRADLVVEDKVIVEIKSVELIAPVPQEAASDLSPACTTNMACSSTSPSGPHQRWHHVSSTGSKTMITQRRQAAKSRRTNSSPSPRDIKGTDLGYD